MNNKIFVGALALVLVAGTAFYAGTAYGKGTVRANARVRFAAGNMGGGAGQFSGARGQGGFTAGQIVTKDDTSITIKLPDGSTKIVLLSTSTPVVKSAAGTLADLLEGVNVLATGTANSDGSITAQSIQVRPTGSPMFSGEGQGQ